MYFAYSGENLDRKLSKRAVTMIIAKEMKNKMRNPKFLNRLDESYSSDYILGSVFGFKESEISTM